MPVLHTSRVKLQRRCDLARLMVSEFERRLVWLHVLGSRPPCSPSLEPVDAEQLEECAQIPQPGPQHPVQMRVWNRAQAEELAG